MGEPFSTFSNSRAVRPRQGADDADTGQTTSAPEYSFDGYTVEVSQKIALTPLSEQHRHHPRRADEQPRR